MLNSRFTIIKKVAVLLGVLVMLVACASPTPSFSVSATDAMGNQVDLTARPARIISLTLGTDEILLDLVGPERLIGITYLASDASTSNIADRTEIKRIPNTVKADPEQIISLQPDLVFVGTFTDKAVLDQLKGAGVKVYAVGSFNSIQAMEDNIRAIGKVVGEEAKAEEMVAGMNAALDQVAQTIARAQGEKPTVLYLANDGWAAGSATTVDDIITRAGGVNAAADLTDWNQVSQEAIIGYDPDVVILSTYVTDDEFLKNPAYASLKAVTNGRVVALSDAHMSATSQYIVRGVEDVARVLYPDLFAKK